MALHMKRRKLAYGFGINDADYLTQDKPNGTVCKYYKTWRQMLRRCYSKGKGFEAYDGCIVCDEWRSFMSFKRWMSEQDWQSKDLDKDILSSECKIYSPDTCIFIPHWINSFTNTQSKNRGGSPIGTHLHKDHNLYMAYCRHPKSKVREYLGWYKDPEVAYGKWLSRKLEIAFEFKGEMDAIDPRLYNAVVDKIKRAI